MKYTTKIRPGNLLVLVLFVFSTYTFSQSQPYVILISFDGFRWDYAERGLTPNIELLIQNGIKAKSFQPVFPTKTFPNHISIVTGMYPENHGIIFNDFNDPQTQMNFKIRDSIEVQNSFWYKGEAFWETARRQGVVTASFFWPSSEINIDYRRPNYFHHYEHNKPYEERVQGVLDWLKLPYGERPHFITLYFDLTDGVGHRKGPNSPEINLAIASLDNTLGSLLSGLKEIGMEDSINIILVSDHGQTEVTLETIITVEEILTDYNCEYSNNGPVMMVSPVKHEMEKVFSVLKEHENNYNVYKKENIPSYYHFSQNPMISDILLVADLGWSLVLNKDLEWMKQGRFNGDHGYDNFQLDMHGVFIASGPEFKDNYKTGTLNCLDVYPLLCKLFNIIPNSNIDGQLDRIEFILN
jgi:predicted AlkP superfamily pyrophosphatase or phosphodiesterase